MSESKFLDEFMKDFSTKGKYDVPLGLLPDKTNDQLHNEGIEVSLVFYWSYKEKLLNENINELVLKYDVTSLDHDSVLTIMKSTIGNELLNDYFNKLGKEFVVDYIAFTSQWEFSFYKDLENLYPNIANFSEIPQSEKEYERIFSLLSSRFEQYNKK